MSDRMDAEIRAAKLNADLARATLRVAAWWLTCAVILAAAAVFGFCVAAMPTAPSTTLVILLAVAASLGSLICGVLFVDAYGQWREIKGRTWKSATPRFSRGRPASFPSEPDSTGIKPTPKT